MADSSLVKKLGIKPGQIMLILNAPEGYIKLLGTLPEGAEVKTSVEGIFDFVQAFMYTKADVEIYAIAAMRALKPGGLLWFTYPKKTSNFKTDISRDIVWEEVMMMNEGIRPVTQIAVDETWSALRFRPTIDVKSKSRS